MKHIVFLFLFSIAGIVGAYTQQVADLFKDVINFEGTSVNNERPIPSINKIAAQQADTIFFLTKDNATQVFREAKKYQSCVISIERHTIVLVQSWTNCSKSGSWNYCMPYGIGYIQRDEMVKKEDYIKNIIGTPDFQRRTVFLFNKK